MVPFIDLAKQQERVRPEIEANIKKFSDMGSLF